MPAFAQYLMNWKYDPVKANTCINNEEKENMVSACMNRFEEFAYHLKNANTEWFEANVQNALSFSPVTVPNDDIVDRQIEKDIAVKLFNEIYSDYPIKKEGLSKKLSQYGITPYRDKTNDRNIYKW